MVMVDTACGNLRPNVIRDVSPVLRLLDSRIVFIIHVIIEYVYFSSPLNVCVLLSQIPPASEPSIITTFTSKNNYTKIQTYFVNLDQPNKLNLKCLEWNECIITVQLSLIV